MRFSNVVLSCALLISNPVGARAVTSAGLATVSPDKVGLSAAALSRVDDYYRQKVARSEISGIVLLIARHGKVAHLARIGRADLARKTPFNEKTVVSLASMTKPLTAVALMQLFEQGRFQMTDPVAKFLPEFSNVTIVPAANGNTAARAPDRPVTVEDTLRHTTGLAFSDSWITAQKPDPIDMQLWGTTNSEIPLDAEVAELARVPLRYSPGSVFFYSSSPDIEARLVEVLSGIPFQDYLRTHVLDPLDMTDTGFSLDRERSDRAAIVYKATARGLQPDPAANDRRTLVRGAGGLHSTAIDYFHFAQMMLDGGKYRGKSILSPATVRFMTSDHLGDRPMIFPTKGLGFGLGFSVIKSPVQMGCLGSVGTFFWSGAYSTLFWIDRDKDLVVVAMMQRSNDERDDVERANCQLHNLVYGALVR